MNVAPAMQPDVQSQLGVIWCYRFDGQGRPSPQPREETPSLAPAGEGFVWIHLDLVHTGARRWIAEQSATPAEARDMFLSHDALQRLDHSAETVWGITHDIARDIADRGDSVGALHWIIGERFLLTGRRQALQSARLAAEALNRGEPMSAPTALFERIVEYVIDDVAEAVIRLTLEVDGVEDRLLNGRIDDAPMRVGAVRRSTVRLHRQLNGLHLLFRRFAETSSGRSAPEAVKACAARLLQRVDNLHHDVHLVQERARLLQDEIAARAASQTNRQLYVLSILTAVFLPATFITGLFGVNAKGVPWGEDAMGFSYVALICIAAAWGTIVLLKRCGVIG